MNFVDRFSSYTYGRSGQIQEGENNLAPNSLKSKQVCTDIGVSIIKSPIKNKRKVVKVERTATDGPSCNSGAQRHRDADFSIVRLIQDDQKITILKKCDANERRDYMSNVPLTSFSFSIRSPAKTFSLCDKAFSQKWNLEIHNRSHMRNKPYKCKECGKAFSQSSCLESHS
ncbi:hypothetical protein AVEN_13162-1 [Araneus ventricosus]|uniref:C2H2-type domain-containing protein n=1 Tax=Araneus ventricosus TaxID=182803 RepID=A0A4Y2E153_ARAVE|nr:hypothetical protein AVEN_13162-1 [Araneus ventricosus]